MGVVPPAIILILMEWSFTNQPFWGTPIYGNPHMIHLWGFPKNGGTVPQARRIVFVHGKIPSEKLGGSPSSKKNLHGTHMIIQYNSGIHRQSDINSPQKKQHVLLLGWGCPIHSNQQRTSRIEL